VFPQTVVQTGIVTCLTEDRDALLAFFDFPAEHWDHLRTSNPIGSLFATVRHRTVRMKGSSALSLIAAVVHHVNSGLMHRGIRAYLCKLPRDSLTDAAVPASDDGYLRDAGDAHRDSRMPWRPL
jgi:Transposase, Mutator family